MNYIDFFKNELLKFKNDGFYRKFLPIKRSRDIFPLTKINFDSFNNDKNISDNDIKIWCTNDYLNMSHNEQVIDRMVEVIREVGTGSGGTRNISGTTQYHIELESKLAKFHNRESALIFNSAYLANQSTLWTLCKKLKDIQVFSDELNHASLIQGIKNSGAECEVFKHNDLSHLESLLKKYDHDKPKLIVFESLYSMDGTLTNVSEYVDLAKKYNALTYLDEVHAVGLYGDKGSGIANKYGVSNEIDIINGTLAKAFGQIGGYIAGNKELIDFIRSFTPGFIFTTSIMPSVAAASKKSIEIAEQSDFLRKDIHKKANHMRKALTEVGIPFINGQSHIIPLITNSADKTRLYSQELLKKYKIYVQPIFYPTVPKDTARLRITITPKHTYQDVDHLIRSLCNVYNIKRNISPISFIEKTENLTSVNAV